MEFETRLQTQKATKLMFECYLALEMTIVILVNNIYIYIAANRSFARLSLAINDSVSVDPQIVRVHNRSRRSILVARIHVLIAYKINVFHFTCVMAQKEPRKIIRTLTTFLF